MINPTVILVGVACLTAFIAFSAGLLLRDLLRPKTLTGDEELDALAAELPEQLWRRQNSGALDEAFLRLLEQSGSRLTPGAAAMLVVACSLLGGGVPFLLSENLLATAAGMLGGGIVPFLGWAFRRWRRLRAMQKRLPEALDVVADVIHSGRTLEQAIQQAAIDMTGPLAEEFSAAFTQMELGHSGPAVMERLARRIPLAEFRGFAVAVLIHRRTGGNLAELSQRLARAARDRQEFYGHLSAVSAGNRLSVVAMLIGSALAVLALGALQPNYYGKFFHHAWGVPLTGLAIGLHLVGIYWVFRILKVRF